MPDVVQRRNINSNEVQVIVATSRQLVSDIDAILSPEDGHSRADLAKRSHEIVKKMSVRNLMTSWPLSWTI